MFLGGRALAQVILPIATHLSITWSVCLSSVTPVHRDLDGFRCHLAGALAAYNDTLCWMGVPGPPEEREIYRSNPAAKIRNCKLLLRSGKQKGSNSAQCQITLVLVPVSTGPLWPAFHALRSTVDDHQSKYLSQVSEPKHKLQPSVSTDSQQELLAHICIAND